jgi:hypothetical protein
MLGRISLSRIKLNHPFGYTRSAADLGKEKRRIPLVGNQITLDKGTLNQFFMFNAGQN